MNLFVYYWYLVNQTLQDQESTPSMSVASTSAMGIAVHNKYIQNQPFLNCIVAKLGIPHHLTDQSNNSLRFAYQ